MVAGYALTGFCVGALIGMTGVGGGSLMTPLLVLLFGIHPVAAVGTDLLYAAATKSVGTLVHGFTHTVDWQVVRRLATGSVPMAILTLLVLSFFDLSSDRAARLTSRALGAALLATALALVFRGSLLAYLGTHRSAFPSLANALGNFSPGISARWRSSPTQARRNWKKCTRWARKWRRACASFSRSRRTANSSSASSRPAST